MNELYRVCRRRFIKLVIFILLHCRLVEASIVCPFAARRHLRLVIQLIEFKCLSVLHSDILTRGQTVQIEDQVEHLLVGLFVVEGDNGDAIVDLVGEGVHAVVYDHHVFHSSVGNDSQVFDVVALRRLNAVLPVQSILE